MAAESNDERTARIYEEARIKEEARVKAQAQQREKEEHEAQLKRERDDRLVMLYSIHPEFSLILNSERLELIKMSNGTYDKIKTRENVTIKFAAHRGRARLGDMPTIRKIHGYGSRFMEALNLKDGDTIACSLEKLIDDMDVRAQSFGKMVEDNGKRTNSFQRLNLFAMQGEIKKLKAAAK